MSTQSFDDLLTQSLAQSQEGGTFSSRLFFDRWFRDEGTSYFFLFHKNAKVTNIQFAELIALLRKFVSVRDKADETGTLLFLSASDFNNSTNQLLKELASDAKEGADYCKRFTECYSSTLKRTLVVDVFHGSCGVFIPPHLEVDIKSVCAFSGYIHSCGRSVFIRKVDKTTKEGFLSAVDRYLSRINSDKPTFFTVYAHEDFTSYDRTFASTLRDGLDDVKLYVEKFYMGSESLVSVLKDMQDRFQGRLVIPEPGNYHEKHKEFRSNGEIDETRTIWLIIDHAIGNAVGDKGDERYYICYDQEFKNKNPFHLFDENKPAWIAHTTIPHTLAGAMLNITLPWWPSTRTPAICDPFAGTGTTWLEALKFQDISVRCSDIEEVAPFLALDNILFFCAPPEQLEKYSQFLSDLENTLMIMPTPAFASTSETTVADAYDSAIGLLERIKPEGKDFSFSLDTEVVKELRKRTGFERIFFYLALRTTLRHLSAFDRASEDWRTAFLKEASVLALQIEELQRLKVEERHSGQTVGSITTFIGSYSKCCSISFEKLQQWATSQKVAESFRVMDARKIEKDSYDVILSDPPYGFNVEHEATHLAVLYAEVIRAMILALRENGQLVLCLPERSFTGRPLPFCTDKRVITQQVLTIAEECGKEVIVPSVSFPVALRAPFYWESERALRRSILHFRFKGR